MTRPVNNPQAQAGEVQTLKDHIQALKDKLASLFQEVEEAIEEKRKEEKKSKMDTYLKLAKDFSETPGARSEGNFSGEEFYKGFLKPCFEEALNKDEILIIDLDGTIGYGTSFLDEAFGSLSRDFGKEVVLERIKFISNEEPYLTEEIKHYINEARIGEFSNA